MFNINVDWSILKSHVSSKQLLIQFIEDSNNYYIYCLDGPFGLQCTLQKSDPKSVDQLDFEDNYKGDANKPLIVKNPSDGVQQVAIVESEGTAFTIITHDWADISTWINSPDSTWSVAPAEGKILIIKKAEVQFSHDVQLSGITKLRFDTWVYNPLYDPNLPTDPDDPTFVPGVSSGNPLKFLYDRSEYSSIKDVLNYGNDHFTMPAVDGMTNSMTTVQFNYSRAIMLKHSQGAEIRINLENDTPMQGEFCTISLIVNEKDE